MAKCHISTFPCVLTKRNIARTLRRYRACVAEIGQLPTGRTAEERLLALKRKWVEAGPYPKVSWSEGANRIMADLVMLHGVKWLLENSEFPFTAYKVDYGNANTQPHDIMAKAGRDRLCGEAFNVSKHLFSQKKNGSLQKLERTRPKPRYRVMVFNQDAIRDRSTFKPSEGVHCILVDTANANVEAVPPV
jgi:hypothetical protein